MSIGEGRKKQRLLRHPGIAVPLLKFALYQRAHELISIFYVYKNTRAHQLNVSKVNSFRFVDPKRCDARAGRLRVGLGLGKKYYPTRANKLLDKIRNGLEEIY